MAQLLLMTVFIHKIRSRTPAFALQARPPLALSARCLAQATPHLAPARPSALSALSTAPSCPDSCTATRPPFLPCPRAALALHWPDLSGIHPHEVWLAQSSRTALGTGRIGGWNEPMPRLSALAAPTHTLSPASLHSPPLALWQNADRGCEEQLQRRQLRRRRVGSDDNEDNDNGRAAY